MTEFRVNGLRAEAIGKPDPGLRVYINVQFVQDAQQMSASVLDVLVRHL